MRRRENINKPGDIAAVKKRQKRLGQEGLL